jgi:hypothetical protein
MIFVEPMLTSGTPEPIGMIAPVGRVQIIISEIVPMVEPGRKRFSLSLL